MTRPSQFPLAVLIDTMRGRVFYRTWMIALMLGCAAGAAAWVVQVREGLIVTNMTDQVSWGVYIANFTFIGGVAAAAITVVVPAHAYRIAAFRKIVFVGETMALTGMAMCLLFVSVDVGRPERSWHLVPFWGSLNFPVSLLSWDVVVVFGYLTINFVLLGLKLWAKFYGRRPLRYYVPLIFVSMAWAIGIYTVEAFLYTWLGARPYWNSAIVAPRFIASAFVSGPALYVLTLRVMRRWLGFEVEEDVFQAFKRIIAVTLLVDLFLFVAEAFTELYGGSQHSASMRFLLFGRLAHHGLSIYVWTGLAFMVTATVILLTPLGRRPRFFDVACVLGFIGVWIEKGMALVVPGFVPTPLGEVAGYIPSVVETMVSFGIWCFGALMFTVLVRLGARIESGQLRAEGVP